MRPWLKRALLASAVGPLLLGAGWFGVGFVTSSAASGALAERGMHCEPVDVSFALDLSSVDLAPTSCSFEGGRIRELRLTGGGHAELDAEQHVTRVEAGGIELDLAEDPPRDVIRGLVHDGEVPARVRDAMRALAELSTRDDLPELDVRRVVLRRRTQFVSFSRVTLAREAGAIVIGVQQAAPPPIGREPLRIAGRLVDLEIRGSATDARISGRLEIEATLGRRQISEAVPFTMTGAGLDGDAPSFAVDIELSERLRELRERRERRVAAAEAAAAEPPGPPPREAIRAMRDSLRETLASMQRQD